jgi:hypothetical protein
MGKAKSHVVKKQQAVTRSLRGMKALSTGLDDIDSLRELLAERIKRAALNKKAPIAAVHAVCQSLEAIIEE